MKHPAFATTILIALLVLPAGAAAPKKPPLATYTSLWMNSPFTTKPVVESSGPAVEVNPFEDWALGGVSTLNGLYRVVLFSRKEANLQKVISQADSAAEFQIVEVKQDPKDYKKTEVTIASGAKRGKVTYDDKVLSTRGAAAAKAQAQAQMQAKAAQAAQARGQVPPQPGQPNVPGQPGQRPPRMRVIPQPGQPGQGGPPGQSPGGPQFNRDRGGRR